MLMQMHDPNALEPNPWNSNTLTPEAELKLSNSIERLGMFKPIVVREHDGKLQILGGQHRRDAACNLGLTSVPVINLGVLDDTRAMEIGLVDNGRYGHDDSALLAKIIAELGDPTDLATFMPFNIIEIDAMTAISRIDLDSLDLDEHDAAPPEKRVREQKTHAFMKFKIPVADVAVVEDQINAIIGDQELEDSDSLVNAGDALIWLVRAFQQRDL